MPTLRTRWDPKGYYARLGVAPSASPEAIAAAYRRQARLVHPDVPETGDATAFVALKLAYDVLIRNESRVAYDRSMARTATAEQVPGEINPKPFPEMVSPVTRHPRLRDLPVAVWAGLASVVAVGVIEIGLHLTAPTARIQNIPATARGVPAAGPAEAASAPYGSAPVRLAGTTNFYIAPAAGEAMLWRAGDTGHRLEPWGKLPPFSAVQGLRLLKASGMVEVRVTDNANGYIEAGRLTPGDAVAASRAWCTYNAGPSPVNGEVLTRGAVQDTQGSAVLSFDNLTGGPAVVKLRGASGGLVASIFLEPGGSAAIDGLPAAPAWLDFATGEVWSRACHGFAAAMRARRLPGAVAIGTTARVTIPPEGDISAGDLADRAFEQE